MSNETDSLRRQLEYRKRFAEKMNEIHSASDLNTILVELKDGIADLFETERITIFIADKDRNALISRAKSGNEVDEISVPISVESIAGYCAVSGQLVNIRNAYDGHELKMINSSLRFDKSWDRKTGFRTAQVLCAPLKFNHTLIGVIQIMNTKDQAPFSDFDATYLTELGTSLAIAVHNINRLTATTKTSRQKSRYNYLLDRNIIGEEELAMAVGHPDAEKIGLDQFIMQHFGVQREDMAKSLSLFFGTEFVYFDPELPPLTDIVGRVKAERLRKERWVPIKVDNGVLIVAMEDPNDLGKHDLIRFIYPENKRIGYVASFREDIERFVDHFYHRAAFYGDVSAESIAEVRE